MKVRWNKNEETLRAVYSDGKVYDLRKLLLLSCALLSKASEVIFPRPTGGKLTAQLLMPTGAIMLEFKFALGVEAPFF
ncbi:MAG: hypothetical protein IPM25_02610 [Chloracidobacterium sp.]|nr:hypothetical protein [Chloracidobacterium sp.]